MSSFFEGSTNEYILLNQWLSWNQKQDGTVNTTVKTAWWWRSCWPWHRQWRRVNLSSFIIWTKTGIFMCWIALIDTIFLWSWNLGYLKLGKPKKYHQIIFYINFSLKLSEILNYGLPSIFKAFRSVNISI